MATAIFGHHQRYCEIARAVLQHGLRWLVTTLVDRLVIAWLVGTSLIALSVMPTIYRPDWIEGWPGAATTVAAGGFLALVVLRQRL